MDGQLAEAPAEGLVLVHGELLIAEEDHAVLDESVVDGLERGLIEPGEIHVQYFGSDMRRQLPDLHRSRSPF